MRWWVRAGGEVFGPVPAETLIDSLRTGRILPSDLACKEDGKDWLLVSAVPEVVVAFAPRPSVRPLTTQDPWTEPVWMVGNLDGEIIVGPLSLAAINDEVRAGKLTGDEMLARAGNAAWRPMAEIAEEHRRALSSRPPPVGSPSFPPARPSAAPPPPPRRGPPPRTMIGDIAMPLPLPTPLPAPVITPAILSAPRPPIAQVQHAPPMGSQAPTPHFPAPQVPPPMPVPMRAPTPAPAPVRAAPPPMPSRPPPQKPPAPPAPKPDGIEWWLARGGPIEGPLTTAQLRNGLAVGSIDPQTQACRGDRQEWRPIVSFEELRAQGTTRPPPLPPRR